MPGAIAAYISITLTLGIHTTIVAGHTMIWRDSACEEKRRSGVGAVYRKLDSISGISGRG